MKAMILAAGRGERMRPLTDHTPKPLLKVGGKPLIVWHIERLVQAGFKQLVINHAHLGQQIEDTLGDGEQWGAEIQYSPERVALETAGGIANALHLLQGGEKGNAPFLVVNGDVFTEINFRPLKKILHPPYLAHLVMVSNPIQHPQGDFCLQGDKLQVDGESRLTFSGVGVYSPIFFQEVIRGQAAKLAPLLKAKMAQSLVTGQYYQGVWHDIGTPERLKQLDTLLS
jgi:N-acetyl-alpha-D-muramate 1-phosphate uridylyltransferase